MNEPNNSFSLLAASPLTSPRSVCGVGRWATGRRQNGKGGSFRAEGPVGAAEGVLRKTRGSAGLGAFPSACRSRVRRTVPCESGREGPVAARMSLSHHFSKKKKELCYSQTRYLELRALSESGGGGEIPGGSDHL